MSQVIEVVERYILPDLPEIDLPEEDGVPLESNWHRAQINLLIDNLTWWWRERHDYFTGGNMFIYYSMRQVRNRDYKGPDFFVVTNVDGSYPRQKWVVWEEDGRYPDVIVELMSPSTRDEDLGSKKQLYEQTFKTRNYFCYDPETQQLSGWRLVDTTYAPIEPDSEGRLWSDQLGASLGLWEGFYQQTPAVWIRFFAEDETLIATEAEALNQRVAATEAELARLQAELAQLRDN